MCSVGCPKFSRKSYETVGLRQQYQAWFSNVPVSTQHVSSGTVLRSLTVWMHLGTKARKTEKEDRACRIGSVVPDGREEGNFTTGEPEGSWVEVGWSDGRAAAGLRALHRTWRRGPRSGGRCVSSCRYQSDMCGSTGVVRQLRGWGRLQRSRRSEEASTKQHNKSKADTVAAIVRGHLLWRL